MSATFSYKCTFRCKNSFKGPAPSDTSINGMAFNPEFFRPGGHRLGFALKSKVMVISLVKVLGMPIGPDAVIRGITKFIINSFDRVFRSGARPHILVEVLNRVFPAVTYGYTSTTIVMKSLMSGVEATLFHTDPHPIFRGRAKSMRSIVHIGCFFKTTTTFNNAFCNGNGNKRSVIPTVAATNKETVPATFRVNNIDNSKHVELLSDKIHAVKFSHFGLSQRAKVLIRHLYYSTNYGQNTSGLHTSYYTI